MTERLLVFILSTVLFFTNESLHAQSINGIINSYARVSSITGTTLTITNLSGSITDFEPGHKVLLIQMKGADINRSNTSAYGSIVDLKEAGNYEYAIVDKLVGAGPNYTLTLHHLSRPFDVSGDVQIVSVPQYDDVTVSGNISALPWNRLLGTGGVLVLEVSGTLTLAADIDVSGKGFAGGGVSPTQNGNGTDAETFVTTSTILGQKGEGIAAYGAEGSYGMGALANGGGGGNTHNAGGGGGGNFSAGGLGGDSHYGPGGNGNPGKRIIIAPTDNKIFMGGGGGGGQENNSNASPGGAGGGIIIVRAQKLVSDCEAPRSIAASGAHAANTTGNDGGGGGGAGGTILLEVGAFELSCDINISTLGGNGGSVQSSQRHAGGGGGGAGAVLLPLAPVSLHTHISSHSGTPGKDCTDAACSSSGASGAACAGNACDGDDTWPLLPNTAPIAYDDVISTAKDASVTIAVLDNDKDADFGAAFTVSAVSAPVNGSVELSGNNFIYTPNSEFIGSDSFEYMICDNGSPVLCNTATVTINVEGIVLSDVESLPLEFTEGQLPLNITELTINQSGGTILTGLDIEISNNYVSSEDLLAFTDASGISDSWDAASGILTLTGNASFADYEMALHAVTYQNTNNNNPSNLTRTISFRARAGVSTSNTLSRSVHILPVNDAPLLSSIEATALNYTEGQPATAITSSIVVSDVDHTSLSGASITIADNYYSAEDRLIFSDANGITGSWDAGTGTLTLAGNASISDYQSALRAVKYRNTNADNPSHSTRRVEVSVSDGTLTSNLVSRDISLELINDPPVLSAVESATLTYVEGSPAIALTAAILVDDVDDANLESAVLKISAHYVASEDILNFSDANGITGSWDADNGTLTLTGSATIAEYQAALRSVAYLNLNDDKPFPSTRTISFSVSDGSNISNTLTRKIAITPVNDAPALAAIETTELEFTEGDAAKAITASLATSDVDNANLNGATVAITANYMGSEDVLAFPDANGITGSWDAATGTLTLSGSASLAHYQSALRSITYQNTNNDNPSASTRTVSFTVSDGSLSSNTVTRNIEITPVNDAPALAEIETASLTFTEGDAAKAITASLTTSDVDNANLVGAIVEITTNYLASEDLLSFTNANGITGSWDAATGTLTLSGTASLVHYQAALRSITYQNTNNDNPFAATRTVSFTVSDGSLSSNTVTRNIEITPVNDAPALAAIETSALMFTEGDAAKAITATLATADVDNTNLNGATVAITVNYLASEDLLSFTNANGITGSWDAATGTLTLSGTASLVHYQSALRSITYQNTNNDNPSASTRTVSFTVSDGNLSSNTVTRNIEITPVNDAPELTGIESVALQFTEGDPATFITIQLESKDVDNTTLTGAVVEISSNYLATEDVLGFTDSNGITGTWDAETGTLNLAGTASVSDYQTALRTVTYKNTNNAKPSELNRTVNFAVNDGALPSNVVSREITIIPVNDPPILEPDVAITDKNVAVDINVLQNDLDVEEDALQVSAATVTPPSHGTVVLNADQTFTYTPEFNFFGSDSFVYEVCDDGSPVECTTAIVNITINYKNYPPVALDDVVETKEDEALVIEVLTNDSDPDLDEITVSSNLISKPKFGKLVLADNKYTYTPNLNYNGSDAFQYEICDNGTHSICVTATVDIYVESVNDAPEPADDFYKNKDVIAEIIGNVLENDYDIEADRLIISLDKLVLPRNGELMMRENGDFSYLPNQGFFGEDVFEYYVCDDGDPSLCTKATVSLLVSSGVPKGFSPNGDNTNDEWIITGLEEFPMNKVVVLNRYGDTVFEMNGYDNASRVWRGESNKGLKMGGSNLPDGTYFYVIDFGDGKSAEKGFIIIKR